MEPRRNYDHLNSQHHVGRSPHVLDVARLGRREGPSRANSHSYALHLGAIRMRENQVRPASKPS